jgi:hypothetical protein
MPSKEQAVSFPFYQESPGLVIRRGLFFSFGAIVSGRCVLIGNQLFRDSDRRCFKLTGGLKSHRPIFRSKEFFIVM